jgi:hypothetical protein
MPAESVPKQIIGKFVDRAAAIDGVTFASDREDRDVPAEIRDGACVVALWRACPQVVSETGGGSDVTWEWAIRIYVSLITFDDAQESFYTIVPAVLALGQSDGLTVDLQTIGNVYVGSLELTDTGGEPHYEIDEAWAMKELRLRIQSYQPPIA